MTLAAMLDDAAARSPHAVAIHTSSGSLSYAELADRVARVAHGFMSLGLTGQDRLAFLLPNGVELAISILAAAKAGLIAVPLSPTFAPPQVEYILRHSGARMLVTSPALLRAVPAEARGQLDAVVLCGDSAEESPPGVVPFGHLLAGPAAMPAMSRGPASDPIGLLVYTSGTTSRPKGVAHTQGRMAHRVRLFIDEMTLTADDATLACVSIGRPAFLLSQLMPMLCVGGSITLLEHHDAEFFWRSHADCRPTYLFTPPGLTRDLLESESARAADFSRLRYWIVGGDKCPAAVHALVADVVRKPLLEICGMTETGFYCICPPHGPRKPGSIGQAMVGVAVRIVTASGADTAPGEVGRILVRTPDMMVGYWNDTLATHRMLTSGWLDTEDLAWADEEGFLWFAGRQKDMISRGGFKVAPALVEEAILAHPGVATAAVVGASDERQGQVPVAFYELRPGAVDPNAEALTAWTAARVEPLSVPVRFYRVDRWPRTAQGKLDLARLVWMADFGDGREL
jgi:long-chain acyl-CoA synthetase